jgi:hypothetical protein
VPNRPGHRKRPREKATGVAKGNAELARAKICWLDVAARVQNEE